MVFRCLQLISSLSAKLRCLKPFPTPETMFRIFGSRNAMLSISKNGSSHRWLTWYFVSLQLIACYSPKIRWGRLLSLPQTSCPIFIVRKPNFRTFNNHHSQHWLTWYLVSCSSSPAFLRNSGVVNRFLSWFTHFDFNSDAPRSKTLYLDQSLLAPLFKMIFRFSQLIARFSAKLRCGQSLFEPIYTFWFRFRCAYFNSDALRSKTRYLDQSLPAPLFDMIFSYLAGYLTVITRISLNVLEPTNNRKAQERAARAPYSKSGLPFQSTYLSPSPAL